MRTYGTYEEIIKLQAEIAKIVEAPEGMPEMGDSVLLKDAKGEVKICTLTDLIALIKENL